MRKKCYIYKNSNNNALNIEYTRMDMYIEHILTTTVALGNHKRIGAYTHLTQCSWTKNIDIK